MGVRRKATIIGILAVLLTAATVGESRMYGRVVTSMRSIQRNFGDLKKAESKAGSSTAPGAPRIVEFEINLNSNYAI